MKLVTALTLGFAMVAGCAKADELFDAFYQACVVTSDKLDAVEAATAGGGWTAIAPDDLSMAAAHHAVKSPLAIGRVKLTSKGRIELLADAPRAPLPPDYKTTIAANICTVGLDSSDDDALVAVKKWLGPAISNSGDDAPPLSSFYMTDDNGSLGPKSPQADTSRASILRGAIVVVRRDRGNPAATSITFFHPSD